MLETPISRYYDVENRVKYWLNQFDAKLKGLKEPLF